MLRGVCPAIALVFVLAVAPAAALPPGFTLEPIGSDWNEAVGMAFAADGRMYVWERGGRIWHVDSSGVKSDQPVLDISDEVGAWRDYGMLGVAFHPNFLQNGHVYLLYVVDRHHLLHAGTPHYNPDANHYFAATIGRLTRYTLESSSDFMTTDYESRLVLIGDTAETGFPILHQTHGAGSLVFGADGTLLVSIGEGASYGSVDTGSAGETYYLDALEDGIIEPEENVGAFRAQMVGSMSGKILRIDPATGAGLASNPFYDASTPFSDASRVWGLGVRNPYRMVKRPGTGSHDPADGDPGVFLFGDVGWDTWEEIDLVDGPGLNWGWPNFEGIDLQLLYHNRKTPNQEAPNPLFGQFVPGVGRCDQQYFTFSDLIVQATLDPNPSFPNPCDPSQQIPDRWDDGDTTWIYHKFVHRRPEVDYRHGASPSRWTSWHGLDPDTTNIGKSDANGRRVPGPQFGGHTSVGGVFYTGGTSGGSYPSEYLGLYFHGDYTSQWIRAFDFDASNELQRVRSFHSGAGGVVHIGAHPTTGDLYYIQWTANVWRIRYVGTGNLPPVAVASQDLRYGPADLTVQFTGDQSSDPNGDPLSYFWDFGDGDTSTQSNPSHTFTAPPGAPTAYTVSLTVDDGADQSQTQLLVSVNNTPPAVDITSIPDGHLYSVHGPDEVFPLVASISDAEQDGGWTCEWGRALHHNEHNHPEPVITDCSTSATTVFSPVGCDGNVYFYRVSLKVTDDQGLMGEDVVEAHPDCPNLPPVAKDDAAQVAQGYPVVIDVLANDDDPDGSLDPASVQVVIGPSHGATRVDPETGEVTYTHDGSPGTSDHFTYRVHDDEGAPSLEALVSVTAFNHPPTVSLDSPPHRSTYATGSRILLEAAADDPEDGPGVGLAWAIHRLHNDRLEPDVFTYSGPDPPAYAIPDVGAPGDRISYLVEVTATDIVGASAVDRAHVVPADPPPNGSPRADLVGSPLIGSDPLSFHADASTSTDPEGDYLLYEWDLGDGTRGFGPSVDHDYEVEGLYTVTLTVTDAGGARSTTEVQVEVLSPGLIGVYYQNADLTGEVLTRNDPVIDFEWGAGSPDPAIDADTFSVRWTGLIEPLYSETYTIFMVSSDGVRLWIDGQLVIDAWVNQLPTVHSGLVDLEAGRRYEIAIEYYENQGLATARLIWISASQPLSVVPATQLFPPLPPNEPPYAVDDLAGTLSGFPVAIDVLANDFDDRDRVDPTSVVATHGANGLTSVDPLTGVVVYQHAGAVAGSDSFTYTMRDLEGATSNVATVVVNALDPSSIAITEPAEGAVLHGPDVTIHYELGGDPSLWDHIHWQTDDGPVVMQFAPYGSWDLNGLASGPHSVRAELNDGQHSALGWPGAADSVSFTINDPPVANDDSARACRASEVQIPVLLNDSDDVGFDPTTVAISQGRQGTVSVHPTSGVVTYSHDGGSTGVDTFTYTVDDIHGSTSNTATVTVTIANAPPGARHARSSVPKCLELPPNPWSSRGGRGHRHGLTRRTNARNADPSEGRRAGGRSSSGSSLPGPEATPEFGVGGSGAKATPDRGAEATPDLGAASGTAAAAALGVRGSARDDESTGVQPGEGLAPEVPALQGAARALLFVMLALAAAARRAAGPRAPTAFQKRAGL